MKHINMFVSLEVRCKNNVIINPQINKNPYQNLRGPFISVNQPISKQIIEILYSLVLNL
jgi:hypothetical protein